MPQVTKMDDAAIWGLIGNERASIADTLAELTADQWATASLCGGWTVRETAAHIVLGAEQTAPHFMARMAANGFRFNTMIDREARRGAKDATADLISRLRARVTTTNRPPAPVTTMLGEVVVHSDDIRRPLGIPSSASAQAVVACLDMYKDASFPLGAKKRIEGLRLIATDAEWAHGDGPEVTGPGMPLLTVMTGRAAGLEALEGVGVSTLRRRMTATR
jgi:uncharacterized protein (TIGR03083 family)